MHCGWRMADGGLFNPFNPKSAIRNSQCALGFTLIELTLVIVTMGIVLLAATPRLQQTAQRLRAEQASTELTQLMRVAHEQAVSSGQEAVWIWDASSHRARIESLSEESGEPDGMVPSSAIITQTTPIPDGISIDVTRTQEPLDCRCVHFFPDGTSEKATLTIRLSEHAFTATVDDATGQVLLSSGTAPR